MFVRWSLCWELKKFRNWDLYHFLVQYGTLELSRFENICSYKNNQYLQNNSPQTSCLKKQCDVFKVVLTIRRLIKIYFLYENLCVYVTYIREWEINVVMSMTRKLSVCKCYFQYD